MIEMNTESEMVRDGKVEWIDLPIDQAAGAAFQEGAAEDADVVAGAVGAWRIVTELFGTFEIDGRHLQFTARNRGSDLGFPLTAPATWANQSTFSTTSALNEEIV